MLSPTSIRTGEIPTSEIVDLVLVVIVLMFVVGALIWFIPKLRKLVVPQITSAATTIWRALRSPRRVAELMIGNTVNALMYAAVMLCCLEAFGGSLNYWTLLSINIIVGTIASLVPIPGGGTAVGAVGMSGALTAVGGAHRNRGRRGARQPAGRQLHPCRARLGRHQGPHEPRLLVSSAGRLEHAGRLAGQRQVDAHRGLHRRRVPDRQPRDHTTDAQVTAAIDERGAESLVEIE